MKKVFLLAVTALAMVTTKVNAQYVSLGPVLGFGDNWVGNLGYKSKFMPSGNLGIGLVYAQKSHWGFGGELKFASEGYKVEDMYGNTGTVDPMYLRLPLHVYYFFDQWGDRVRPKLYLGPTFGVKVAESDNMNGITDDGVMSRTLGSFRTFDFGLNAGAGVNIRLAKKTWLNMDIGYYQGLLDAVNDPAGTYNVNHNLAFNAGILFGLK